MKLKIIKTGRTILLKYYTRFQLEFLWYYLKQIGMKKLEEHDYTDGAIKAEIYWMLKELTYIVMLFIII